jgi:hypothetical protein
MFTFFSFITQVLQVQIYLYCYHTTGTATARRSMRNLCLCWKASLSVGRTPWTGGRLVVRPLPARRITQTQNNADKYPYL